MASFWVYFCLGYDLILMMAASWVMSFLHRTECGDYCYAVTFSLLTQVIRNE